ncbi:major facilitator superfamily transporter [Metarhizium robertsii ARSEF 23]|uniref:Major facilitator superfamily transporter n=1 Tax=Metarhizium robertsii (strain ARSEF 23 / ATCC MYA-3075) TaxID=655844 RepID=E9EVJ9_METRA|nr:major facilitator superfamily transporter [Metarhizium robertsii ARSEF 23]EFZ00271.2 major facilitator superfamily transporter [Metarhizium robertsii ARSEF 23]
MSETPRDEECPGTSNSQTKEMAGHATTQPPYHDKNNNDTRADNTQCEAVTENQVLEPHQSNERPIHSVFPLQDQILRHPHDSLQHHLLALLILHLPASHEPHRQVISPLPRRDQPRRTVYQIMQAIAPLFFGHLRDQIGRRPVYALIANGATCFAKHREKLGSGNWQRCGCRPDSAPGASILELKKLPLGIPVPGAVAAIRIIFEKDVGLLMLFMSLFVMANYAMLVPLQDVSRRRHSFSDVLVGLCYILLAMGSVFGAVTIGRLLNWNYARVANGTGVSADRKRGDDVRRFPIERARLDHMSSWTMLAFFTTAIWGWVVNSGANLAAPLVILLLAGMGLSGPISILTILLVDLYPMNAGRVSSSFNLTRGGISAAGTAVVQYIIDAWGMDLHICFWRCP